MVPKPESWVLTDLTGQLTCNWEKMNYLLDSYWSGWSSWCISIIQHNTYIVNCHIPCSMVMPEQVISVNQFQSYSRCWEVDQLNVLLCSSVLVSIQFSLLSTCYRYPHQTPLSPAWWIKQISWNIIQTFND